MSRLANFRFQDLEIWKEAIEIENMLFDVADEIEKKRLFCFVEQLRSAGMSMSNNITEGSGSNSKMEFRNFLNIIKRSTFENANILIVLHKRTLINNMMLSSLLERLDTLCRRMTNFQKSLTK